jgi:hypothetical protein
MTFKLFSSSQHSRRVKTWVKTWVAFLTKIILQNSALNMQELDSTPASTTTSALENATRQPRRRLGADSETLP